MSYLDRVLENEKETLKIPNPVELTSSLKIAGVTVNASTLAMTGLTASADELNLLDGSVAGTSKAGKALVLGDTKNTDVLALPVEGLKIGTAGAEVAVTPSAAELNYVKGVTSAIQTQLGTKAPSQSPTFTGTITTPLDASRALVTGSSKEVAASATTAAEVTKLNGIPAAGYLIAAGEVTFTETAGAGVYTGSVAVPAGSTIIDIQVQSTALWDTQTSATMIVGDAADPDGFYAAIDLKATDLLVGEVIRFGSTGGVEGDYIVNATGELNSYSAGARTITGEITTVGATGSAGRTRMLVIYVTPTAVAATKAI